MTSIARAEASLSVAKEKCDDLASNTKDACVKEADAVLVKAKADAKVDRVAADSRDDAAAKQHSRSDGSRRAMSKRS